MSLDQVLGIFIGIPAALAAIIWIAVIASGWGKVPPESENLVVISEAPLPDPSRLPRELMSRAEQGGAHGSW
jgi:hypothetical protein